jgi:hypothetical protein
MGKDIAQLVLLERLYTHLFVWTPWIGELYVVGRLLVGDDSVRVAGDKVLVT